MADTLEFCNLKLARHFPAIPGRNQPMFRIVWVDEKLRELRFGTFNIYHGPIFLREVTGTEDREKYEYFKDRFALERWFPQKSSEVRSDEYGSFEAIYIFQDKHNNPLPLRYDIAAAYAQLSLNPVKGLEAKEQILSEHKHKFDNEVAYFEEQLNDDRPQEA